MTTPAGTSATSAADQFTYVTAAAPVVTGLSPTSGPTAGGTLVTITGTGFTGATAVDFGTTAATNVTVVSDTSITADSPAGTAGTVDVTVTTPAGISATSPADQFTYQVVAAPTVTGLSPTTGPAAGGTLVTITGTGFTGATAVDFGTTPATNVTVVSDTSITADSPAGTGVVNVTVTTPGGTSAVSPADQFTYAVAAAPVVTGLSPTSGPATGGTLVTITGTSFTGATAVDFGTTAATDVTVVNDTTITADSPAGTGTVNVTVTTPSGTSATSSADQFTYTAVAAPVVTGLSPTTGPAAGGTLVTITGTGFTGATVVDFGTTAATNVTVVSDSTITADSPAGSGVENVTVTTPSGTSAVSAASQFTYASVAAPTVLSLVRFGFHMQPTSLVLSFSSALDATPAEDVSNYLLMTSSGTMIPIKSVAYDPTALTVTIFPSQLLNLESFYQLTVNGAAPSGLTSSTGVPIDGAGNGTSGTNYVKMFSGGIVEGPAPELLRTAPGRYFAEARELAATDARLAAVPNGRVIHQEQMAAAQKTMAAAVRRLTTQAVREEGPTASAVDHLLAIGMLDFTGNSATPDNAIAIGIVPLVRKRTGN